MSDSWDAGTSPVIGTPRGDYAPKSDDLIKELKEAGKFAGLPNFKVFLDGNMEVKRPSEMPTNSVSALATTIRIEPYDKVA